MEAAVQDHTASDETTRIEVATDPAGQTVRLDLHPALAVLGYYDGVYVVISDVPVGARLSAGRSNGNFTWSLLPAELEDLSLTLPSERLDVVLTVSIVTPDPDGYEFASTSAQFNIIVADGISTIPFNSLRRIDPHHQQDWPGVLQRAVEAKRAQFHPNPEGGPEAPAWPAPTIREREAVPAAPAQATIERDAATQLLAAARIEWRADEEARFTRVRAHWEAEACNERTRIAEELAARHAQELRDAEARWHVREQERLIVHEALWSARLAAQEIHWRSEESLRFAASIANWRMKVRAERWRRAACWFAFTITMGSLLLA
ncbi:MAG: hypothetical protein AB7S71_06690 [Dongiaceae bacterium]